MLVELEVPSDDLAEAVAQDLLAERDTLATAAGVTLVRRARADFTGVEIAALVVHLVAPILAPYAISAIDKLIAFRKQRRHFSMPIVVSTGERRFTIPRDYDACVAYLKELNASGSNPG